MGIKWFAKTVAKTIGGIGAVLAAAEFVVCMVTEMPAPGPVPGGGPNDIIYTPALILSSTDYYEYHKQRFIDYIVMNYNWPTSDAEQMYEWGIDQYGDFGSVSFYHLNEYFKSIYETN